MKLPKIIKIILPVLAVIFLFGRIEFVFGYDDQVAHPNIAELAAELYNQNFEPDLTVEEIGWIKQGSREEDSPTRWFNHFYDPVYGNGFNDMIGMNLVNLSFTSAKDWVVTPSKQVDFSLGDRSWPRGLADFSQNNRQMAFIELGHVIHLISDMAVPAHTRNSEHVGDPFEAFVKNNWTSIVKQLNYNFIAVDNLDNAFIALAKYSNNNFYSEKTIESEKYKIIPIIKQTIIANDKILFISKNEDDQLINLYVANKKGEWESPSYQSTSIINNYNVLLSYSTHLLPKAIGYSAGVIKLFIDEGNKKIAADEDKTIWQKMTDSELPLNRISTKGIFNRVLGYVISGAEKTMNYFGAAQKIEPSLAQGKPDEPQLEKELSVIPPVEIKQKITPIVNTVALQSVKPAQPVIIESSVVNEQLIVEQPIIAVPVTESLISPVIIIPAPQQIEPLKVFSCNGCGGVKDVVEPVVVAVEEAIVSIVETSAVIEEVATTTSVVDISTVTVEIATTTEPVIEETTTTLEIPEMIIMLPPQLDIIFNTTTYTTSSVIKIFGECATNTLSIQVFRVDETTPLSEPELMVWVMPVINLSSWQVEMQINNGESLFYFVAVGSTTSSLFSESAKFVKSVPSAEAEPDLPEYIFTTFDDTEVVSTALSPSGAGSAIFQVVKAPITGIVYSLNTKIQKYIPPNTTRPWYHNSSWKAVVVNVSSETGDECGIATHRIVESDNAVDAPDNLTEITFNFASTTVQKDSFYCFMIYRSYGFTNKAWINILDKSPADIYSGGNALLNGSTIDADIWMKIPIKPTQEEIPELT
ncbi:MAG: hypothetical protein COU29_03530 [Candidatus Magasanikbacteria bacterium CG10_big_fil_rev_8_21_14_0_10_36_32]|uniref:Uncharacterized protein n=1 Tax=Candidatus Magasanikbacteria bacterium CG10_big_fil_rev_8_21_14_0_10_36_32 TaxID=1974646 RepID=A0A2M6W5J0_9BACT|nr:MAG: hypothetical protein COU29_03530 [Candidatus Magasanikbacteria bacterium CG10_big_fil_rev_8_21_14_0_10_36_32]